MDDHEFLDRLKSAFDGIYSREIDVDAWFLSLIDNDLGNLSNTEQVDWYLGQCKKHGVDPLSGELALARVGGKLQVVRTSEVETAEQPETPQGKAILAVRVKSEPPQRRIVLNSTKAVTA